MWQGRTLRFLQVFFLGISLAAAQTAQPPLPTVALISGDKKVTAEVARTPEQLSKGLMFREHMGDNEGMLFVLPEERASFWMENTLLPLTVGYLDADGKVLEIYDMKPLSRDTVASKSEHVFYALEMNQGWFALNHIKPGDVFNPAGLTWKKLRNP